MLIDIIAKTRDGYASISGKNWEKLNNLSDVFFFYIYKEAHYIYVSEIECENKRFAGFQ